MKVKAIAGLKYIVFLQYYMNLNKTNVNDIPSYFTSLSSRLSIEKVIPIVDNGRFSAKFIINEPVKISATIFCDGHDIIKAAVRYWPANFLTNKDYFFNQSDKDKQLVIQNIYQNNSYTELLLHLSDNHCYYTEHSFKHIGKFNFQIVAWIDPYASIIDFIQRKLLADEGISDDMRELLHWLHSTIDKILTHSNRAELQNNIQITASNTIKTILASFEKQLLMFKDGCNSIQPNKKINLVELNYFLSDKKIQLQEQFKILTSSTFFKCVNQLNCQNFLTHSSFYPIIIERKLAHFASWYELFPRSQSEIKRQHGTFYDVITRLPTIAKMGFNVLYFPPVHPIGKTNRKGRNNQLQSQKYDVGSPYAIGNKKGGHTAIHPKLGNFKDFKILICEANHWGIEIALDFAIQCSPDHPWLSQHIDWFDQRADGSLHYAENPPKKYQDIVSLNFYANHSIPNLWLALKEIVLFWIEAGIKIFRVDNPHTKPLPFWEWLISIIQSQYPEVIFLAEALTHPAMMYRLAKCGFSQSYTYFIWRYTKDDFQTYLEELNSEERPYYFRPHFFVNTPDINPQFLQTGHRPAFLIRAALTAMLSGLWGMYSGFEWCEANRCKGKEHEDEYADSEKYQLLQRNWKQSNHIINEISQLNAIRIQNPALHSHNRLRFIPSSNAYIICFEKYLIARDNVLIVAITTDPVQVQSSQIEIPLHIYQLKKNKKTVFENIVDGHFF